jgi:hypothetical protein
VNFLNYAPKLASIVLQVDKENGNEPARQQSSIHEETGLQIISFL